jgi:hypothetical protein
MAISVKKKNVYTARECQLPLIYITRCWANLKIDKELFPFAED